MPHNGSRISGEPSLEKFRREYTGRRQPARAGLREGRRPQRRGRRSPRRTRPGSSAAAAGYAARRVLHGATDSPFADFVPEARPNYPLFSQPRGDSVYQTSLRPTAIGESSKAWLANEGSSDPASLTAAAIGKRFKGSPASGGNGLGWNSGGMGRRNRKQSLGRALHNGARISGDPSLKIFDESTRADASRHEPPFPERAARRIEGGGARDGLGQGSSAAFSSYAAASKANNLT